MPGPPAGITVLDLTRLAPGPFCTMILSDIVCTLLKTPGVGLRTLNGRLWTPPWRALALAFASCHGRKSFPE
jgi:crotonobetainyl-CoA:carnitine CoA-transferase CaiB-like acyl-CoA transferase